MATISFLVRAIFFLIYKIAHLRNFVRSRSTSIYLESYGHSVGENLKIRQGAGIFFGRGSKIRFGSNLVLAESASLFIGGRGTLTIGDNVFIGRRATIVANEAVKIESNTQIAHGVTIIDSDHHKPSAEPQVETLDHLASPIQIGANCWIGANSIILKGVRIGERAVVGAGSVVSKDVGAKITVVGNPARPLA